ncbi:oxidoreductase [Leptospira kirschneri serovar Pomona]|uniref:Oxidoreductase n=1 Tax=Leptospira kirschneri serovar Pomona TaxID=561005 RepID=A0A1T1DRE3_9LEPT|nr:FAD-dependent oxidoreductase [Leptospira kirschneri]OOV43435.1 oxidoreductase [Leptospira kirschneri serovar Pomona]
MRKIAIIGSGIAGLMTAHDLLKHGYDVTLYSDRSPEDWLNKSRPTGIAARFESSLAYERELGLNHWDKNFPPIEGVYLIFSMQPRIPFIILAGRLSENGAAIDVRLQSYHWMNDLVERGGKLRIENIDIPRLDTISAENDLTIVAAGKAEIANLFERNETRSVYTRPQRKLAMVVVKNTGNFEKIPYNPVKFNFIGDHGEAFWIPYYHKSVGMTWNLLFEAKADGKMDKFANAKSGDEVLGIAKNVIKELFPWDYDWFKNAELADENGWLIGALTPIVRNPVGKLPSGRIVTGVGDTLTTLDPIAGQGANNVYRMAKNLVQNIVKRGDGTFDAAWMNNTFEEYYEKSGKATIDFTNLLLEPITDAGRQLLIAQYGSNGVNLNGQQIIANAFSDNFADPTFLTSYFTDSAKVRSFISEKTGRHWLPHTAGSLLSVVRDQIRQKVGMTPGAGYW